MEYEEDVGISQDEHGTRVQDSDRNGQGFYGIRLKNECTIEHQRFYLMSEDEMGIDFGFRKTEYNREQVYSGDKSIIMYLRVSTEGKLILETAEVNFNGRYVWDIPIEEIENAPKGYWEWKEMEEE